MKYPITIELGDDTHAFSVIVPDLEGCFSAGDTMEEAIDNAKEAIELWLETVIDDGGSVPVAQEISTHQKNTDYQNLVWAVVSVDLASLSDKVERVNITLPSRVLRRIDADAKALGESRSGYIARKALELNVA
jgi:predicted RNase H-like HicB family nuclease